MPRPRLLGVGPRHRLVAQWRQRDALGGSTATAEHRHLHGLRPEQTLNPHQRATSTQPEIANTIRAELSDREIEVLKLIANGKDNGQIAADLHISPKTVKNHISNILMKLQIENRIQAAVYAVRSGIV